MPSTLNSTSTSGFWEVGNHKDRYTKKPLSCAFRAPHLILEKQWRLFQTDREHFGKQKFEQSSFDKK
jgi:hypothetical protein